MDPRLGTGTRDQAAAAVTSSGLARVLKDFTTDHAALDCRITNHVDSAVHASRHCISFHPPSRVQSFFWRPIT